MNTVQDLDIQPGTRVILRCDLNLPQDDRGNFTDFFRLESSLPTIEYLKEHGATVFITSHLGSPKGKVDKALSLEPLTDVLTNQLNRRVEFIADPFNPKEDWVSSKGIFLLENLRFWPGEEEDSLNFAKELVDSVGAELFVQDAFGAVHREHASITCLPKVLQSCAGLLLQKEASSLEAPQEDGLVLIVGGAKVESKLPVISNFLNRADSVLSGGVVANTLLRALDKDISSSLYGEDCLEAAKQIIAKAESTKTELLLPEDYLCAKSPEELLAHEFDEQNLQPGQMILDLGPRTVQNYKGNLAGAKTVIWAGTLGFAEKPTFSAASKQVLQELLRLKSQKDLKIIIGGGDTVDFTRDTLSPEEIEIIDHLSTGGGASLLMLSGQELPGIKALEEVPGHNSSQPVINSGKSTKEDPITLANKTPILIANLKSHFNLEESKKWLSRVLVSKTLTSPGINFGIAPADLFIEEANSQIGGSLLKNPPELFTQNISSEEEGSNTGEVAASQLKGIATGSIVGHSERRIKHGETDDIIFQKVVRSTDVNLRVILCVGSKSEDSLTQRREVCEQIRSTLINLNSQQASLVVIAYEPVFAIGTGRVPTKEFLKEQLNSIRETTSDHGLSPKVLYGGSVSSDNAKDILEIGFDGLLVGSASLKPESLEAIGISISA